MSVSLSHMWGSCFLSSAESECVTQHVNLLQTLSMTREEASFTFSKSPAGGAGVNTCTVFQSLPVCFH
jgi:hypothetical protein